MSCARAHAGARDTDPAVGRAGSARLARTGRARRGKAIGHRVQHGARRQCAACGLNHRANPPSFFGRSPTVRACAIQPFVSEYAHARALSRFLALARRDLWCTFTRILYQHHIPQARARQSSGLLRPRARCLRARAHVSGDRPCAADARARRALACVCTVCRRAEGRPCRRLIRTP